LKERRRMSGSRDSGTDRRLGVAIHNLPSWIFDFVREARS